MNKKTKIINRKRKEKFHFKNVGYIIPPCFSKREEVEYVNDMDGYYDIADKELKDFHREGTKLMKKLSKIIGRAEKTDPFTSVFVVRAAEFMVADWLNEINPDVKYGIISK